MCLGTAPAGASSAYNQLARCHHTPQLNISLTGRQADNLIDTLTNSDQMLRVMSFIIFNPLYRLRGPANDPVLSVLRIFRL